MAQQVSDFELAHVVLAYLETKGWAKTAASFQRCVCTTTHSLPLPLPPPTYQLPRPRVCREAKTLFKSGRRPQGQSVRVLDDLVNGYLQMAAREAQRTALCHVNPLAAHMYGLLDMLAGLPPPLPMPQMPNQTQHQHQQQEAAANAAAAAAAAAMMPIAEMGGGAQPLMDPRQPSQPPQQPQLPTAPPQRPATTPGRHVQRKGAPQRKRRRLDADFEAARPLMPQSPPEFPNSNEHSLLGDVPFGDLLYRAVDPAAVMHVLDHEDEALNKFSSLLADNINRTAMGPDHFHEGKSFMLLNAFNCPVSHFTCLFSTLQLQRCFLRTCCWIQRRRRL